MPTAKTKQPGSWRTSTQTIAKAEGDWDRRAQIVTNFIRSQFHRRLTLQVMAKRVGLSPGRFAHLFTAETGNSPQRYLTRVRLEKAKDCLENSVLTVKEIAASVGVPNVSQFCKVFKTAYGLTPSEYRDKNLRIDDGNDLTSPHREPTPIRTINSSLARSANE